MSDNNTLDLTPDADGYAAIGAVLVASVHSDFTKARRDEATFTLSGIIDLAFGFGYAAGRAHDEARGIELRDAMFKRIGGRPLQ